MEGCMQIKVDIVNKRLISLHINHKDRQDEDIIISKPSENAYIEEGLVNKALMEKYMRNTNCLLSENEILNIFNENSFDYEYNETTSPFMNFEKEVGFIYNVVEVYSEPWEPDEIITLYSTDNKEKAEEFLGEVNPNNAFEYYIEGLRYFKE